MNYYDILLAKKLEDNRDPQVVGLSVTENGTYSEEGKVYKPVVVNVPLPSNAYLLQTIEHESIATFTDGTDNFVKSLEVAIEPVQSGSGDPSPTNIRPISGWSAVDVTVADDVDNPTTTKTITIQLGDTYYGGKLDVVNGVLTVEMAMVNLGDLTWALAGSGGATRFETNMRSYSPLFPTNPANEGNIISSQYKNYAWNGAISASSTVDGAICAFQVSNNDKRIGIKDSRYTSASDFKTAMNGVQLVYKLATPQTIQLTPTIVKSLQGANNFFASTGEIELLQYFGKETA